MREDASLYDDLDKPTIENMKKNNLLRELRFQPKKTKVGLSQEPDHHFVFEEPRAQRPGQAAPRSAHLRLPEGVLARHRLEPHFDGAGEEALRDALPEQVPVQKGRR